MAENMISVYIEAEDITTYKRIRYVLTQLLMPIGFPFRFCESSDKNDAVFCIICIAINNAKQITFNSYDLIIPYGDYSQWVSGNNRIKINSIEEIPVLYTGESPRFILRDGRLGFDLINSVFFLLSRQEEYTCSHRDSLDRFAAPHSILYEYGILQMPIINYYIKILEEYLKQSIQDAPKVKWKGNAPYALMISHDVDVLPTKDISIVLNIVKKSFKEKDILSSLRHLKNHLVESGFRVRPKIATWQISHWIDKELEYGFRSTFFMASNTQKRHPKDPTYWIDSGIQFDGKQCLLFESAKRMEDLGWEIGMHGTYNTYQDQSLLYEELDLLIEKSGCSIRGIRQHYLRFDVKKTWKIHENLGFDYDTTLGYSERNGFRAGIAFPFTPYDLQNNCEYNLLELPMSVMDGNFFLDHGEKLNADLAMLRCEKIFDYIKETGGLLVVNFHPHFYQSTHPDWWAVYCFVLNHASETGAWVATGSEITDWWTDRMKELSK
jgi:peptidoglycan/xylan/chitin deacetylase (PgdA/CDA1 family)